MKLTKVAAVIAGSVAALGASASAFAAENTAALPPMSLTSGATEAFNALAPVTEHAPETLGNGIAEQGETVGKVVGTAQEVNKIRNDVPGTVLGVANGVTQSSGPLHGVALNGGSN
ncbi:hypothetical protein AB0F11_04195 [Streptomyces sp. NPDC032472]|uniref:hypothetical protein n=1 Tax=Streptomyces sp. NPDC032472 TaxID=3155018 RepID=UPI0033FB1625